MNIADRMKQNRKETNQKQTSRHQTSSETFQLKLLSPFQILPKIYHLRNRKKPSLGMAQPDFCLNFGKLATEGLKFQTMESFDSTSKDKFHCTYFRHSFSKTPKKKNSIPWLDNKATPDLSSDPYNSDSDSEAENRKNVARWLESLPTNQDWYEIEDDLTSRQGDFEKGTTSTVQSLPKTATEDDFHASQTSISFQNNTPTTSKVKETAEIKVSNSKVPKYKNSLGKMQFGKLKVVHFKEKPTEIRSENSKYAKLLMKRDSQLESNDSKNLSTSVECNEDKVKIRKCPYNLRSLDSRKVERKIEANDSEEKLNGCRRSCSIRNQEYKRKSRANSSANNQAKRNEVLFHVEELKPARKLKSPFTKQASSSNTPALFTGTPCMSSYKLNELKETKQDVQKLDRGKEKQKYVDRKVIVKSRLERNKKLLKTVKDLVNVLDSHEDPVVSTNTRRKSRLRHKVVENSELIRRNNELGTERRTLNVLKQKPKLINSKLEKKLDLSMEVALNRYKRTHETWKVAGNKESSVHLEEPPRKKEKKPVF